MLQALRAAAAAFVVLFHASVLWKERAAPGAVTPWMAGNAGVDLFFVISGFIMVLSTRQARGQPGAWARFLRARLLRIVPLYWLATLAKLASGAVLPPSMLHSHPTAWNIAASFLFIPSHNAEGTISPVLVVGWTLSFEMLFYGVFAVALRVRIAPLLVAAPVLAAVAALSCLRDESWPAPASLFDPIVLEFLLGMLVGHLVSVLDARGDALRVPPGLVWLVGAAGLLWIVGFPADGPWSRVLGWGPGAVAVTLAAVLIEPHAGRRVPASLVALGEASYSLYLTHGFVLPVLGVAAAAVGLTGTAVLGVILLPGGLLACSVVALLVFRWIERPLVTGLRAATTRWPRRGADDQRQPAPVRSML